MKKGTKAILAGAMALTMGASLAAAVGCGYEPITVGEARKIVVGITEYKPMDYKDENGNWVGFDYELSKSVLESLGFTVEYRVIDWDTKTVTLNAQEIDDHRGLAEKPAAFRPVSYQPSVRCGKGGGQGEVHGRRIVERRRRCGGNGFGGAGADDE